MASGKKTGGRNFRRGNPGKPKGAKDTVPRGSRKTVRQMLENILARSGAQVEKKLEQDLVGGGQQARSAARRLLAEYIDGKPVQELRHQVLQPLTILIGPEGADRLSSGESLKMLPSDEESPKMLPPGWNN